MNKQQQKPKGFTGPKNRRDFKSGAHPILLQIGFSVQAGHMKSRARQNGTINKQYIGGSLWVFKNKRDLKMGRLRRCKDAGA